ncbi:hypothetical protein SISSUDRAFT_1049388 [Sistotremastrum suecicum HHB10207 ss-3]|uniref:Uncharacterized protein n=1 Tax=Sistotremastrum suecicum HHB10207 ss-3 TaxID=1314776 RepID=A0A166BUG6_9AGAM|nr:hypothetical protein SISSUDRAFT_1049388 [Sistotremastrum suecicum HHB10207 ss-3]
MGSSGFTCEAVPLIFALSSTRILRVFKHMILVRKCDASFSHIALLCSFRLASTRIACCSEDWI